MHRRHDDIRPERVRQTPKTVNITLLGGFRVTLDGEPDADVCGPAATRPPSSRCSPSPPATASTASRSWTCCGPTSPRGGRARAPQGGPLRPPATGRNERRRAAQRRRVAVPGGRDRRWTRSEFEDLARGGVAEGDAGAAREAIGWYAASCCPTTATRTGRRAGELLHCAASTCCGSPASGGTWPSSTPRDEEAQRAHAGPPRRGQTRAAVLREREHLERAFEQELDLRLADAGAPRTRRSALRRAGRARPSGARGARHLGGLGSGHGRLRSDAVGVVTLDDLHTVQRSWRAAATPAHHDARGARRSLRGDRHIDDRGRLPGPLAPRRRVRELVGLLSAPSCLTATGAAISARRSRIRSPPPASPSTAAPGWRRRTNASRPGPKPPPTRGVRPGCCCPTSSRPRRCRRSPTGTTTTTGRRPSPLERGTDRGRSRRHRGGVHRSPRAKDPAVNENPAPIDAPADDTPSRDRRREPRRASTGTPRCSCRSGCSSSSCGRRPATSPGPP